MEEVKEELQELYKNVAEGCIECGLCSKDCLFLKKYGLPGEIAARGLESRELLRESFSCSLCSLCTAVCPQDIDPGLMFRKIRHKASGEGLGYFKEHKRLLAYERWGVSPLFSWYGLPRECDTVFFPGCAMKGSRSNRVLQVYTHLRKSIAGLGLVLDCCTKPSHDLGRIDFFHETFGSLKRGLQNHGIKKILVSCPSCYRVWKDYGEGMEVRTIYEQFAETGVPLNTLLSGKVTVHDPCSVRNETGIHQSVRDLVAGTGLSIVRMKHDGQRTVCCGEGGAAGCIVPEFARNWTELRAGETGEEQIITYCAGCTNFLSRLCRADHVTDLLFEPEKTLAGSIKVTRPPITWLKRLLLKKKAPGIVKPHLAGARDRKAQVVLKPQ